MFITSFNNHTTDHKTKHLNTILLDILFRDMWHLILHAFYVSSLQYYYKDFVNLHKHLEFHLTFCPYKYQQLHQIIYDNAFDDFLDWLFSKRQQNL